MMILRAVVIGLLAGCASGSIGQLPVVSDPSRAAVVIVARPLHFVGGGATYPITVDGLEVCTLGPGEHIALRIPSGERLIGMKGMDQSVPFLTIHPTVVIQSEPNRTYYVRVTPGAIHRMAEPDGIELVGNTTPIEQNAWQGRGWRDRRP